MFDIMLLVSVGYEYYRREKRHQLVIESLKRGILPETDIQQETIFGLSITLLFTILYLGFMAFLAYFILFSGRLRGALWISAPFLIPWFGIGITLVLITIRNVKMRKKESSPEKETAV